MSFFRVKKIKGKEYAYLVENEWKPRGSRQKVKEYIGRLYRFSIKNSIGFEEFIKIKSLEEYINENNLNKIINDLVEWEFFKSGIQKDGFFIDIADKKIQKSGKNIAISINGGFLCSLTLGNLLEFKSINEENDGYRLARAFVEAGIKVPQEVFIGLFGKIYKSTE